MALGIFSLLIILCPCPFGAIEFIAPLLAILGLILGILSLKDEKKAYAVTGIVMSAITLVGIAIIVNFT